MKKTTYAWTLSILLLSACVNSKAVVDPVVDPVPQTGTKLEVFNITSENTGISYPVHVYLPPGYEETEKDFPVIYWTDGQWYFHGMAGILEELNIRAVMVSVEQGGDDRRATDYMTPGSNTYFKFFADELLPQIEKTYRIDTSERTLSGVSAGGAFSAQALIADTNDPPLFKNYFLFDGALYMSHPDGEWKYMENSENHYKDRYKEMLKSNPELDIHVVLTYSYPRGNEVFSKRFYNEIDEMGFEKLKLSIKGFETTHEQIGGPSFRYALGEVF